MFQGQPNLPAPLPIVEATVRILVPQINLQLHRSDAGGSTPLLSLLVNQSSLQLDTSQSQRLVVSVSEISVETPDSQVYHQKAVEFNYSCKLGEGMTGPLLLSRFLVPETTVSLDLGTLKISFDRTAAIGLLQFASESLTELSDFALSNKVRMVVPIGF